MLSLTTVFQAASEKSIVHVEVCTKELSSEPELVSKILLMSSLSNANIPQARKKGRAMVNGQLPQIEIKSNDSYVWYDRHIP